MPKPRSKRVAPTAASLVPHRIGLIATFALGFVLAFLINTWSTGPSATGPSATDRRIAELREAEARRDVEQIAVLNDLARATRDRLTPILSATAIPTPAEVSSWRQTAAAEVERYAISPSTGNGVNVARTGFRNAVDQVAAAVGSLETALTAPEPLRATLLSQATEQRAIAERTWAVAALQLDVINVEAGNGHVHVNFGSGGPAPDSEPEGSGRVPAK